MPPLIPIEQSLREGAQRTPRTTHRRREFLR